jgi:hypothetical protein
MDNESQFIFAIHNYCDRWCERCDFTTRCRVFAIEAELTDEEKNIESPAFARNLTNILNDAKAMLEAKAAEFGIELANVADEETVAAHEQKRASVTDSDLTRLAEKYAFELSPVLEAKNEWLTEPAGEEDLLNDVLAVLYWYQFFIAAKVERGVSGIIDDEGDDDTEELNDPQSDANGSIKVALMAIERSLLAWTYLIDEFNAPMLRPFIAMLEELKQMAEARFPHARDFIRPGFDEIETVM